MIIGLALQWVKAVGTSIIPSFFTYHRPDAVSKIFRPNGTSIYKRP